MLHRYGNVRFIRFETRYCFINEPRVVMWVVIFLTFLPLGMGFTGDDNYSEQNVDNIMDLETKEDWINEAILDVAFYLRLHKFNDFDRR